MLEVKGKTLIEHKLDALPKEITEIILVVGYLKEKIMEKCGDVYKEKRITYVTQENIVGGTMDALLQAQPHLTGKFLVMMGDDIYSRADISAVLAYDWAMLVQRVPDTAVGGRVVIDAYHNVIDIIEGAAGEGAVNANLFGLDPRLFDYPPVPKADGSSELGLPQTILAASKASGIPLNVVEATRWIQITNPDDLERAGETLSTH